MNHVKAVARLLIVQGIAEMAAALLFLSQARTFPLTAETESKAELAFWFFLTIGILLLICGFLKILAGARNLKFRSRGLGYAALISSLPPVVTCWCAPTGLAIMVYGLIVYSRPEAREPFDRAETALPQTGLGLGR